MIAKDLGVSGVCVYPELRTQESIADTIRSICSDRARLTCMKNRVASVYQSEYSRDFVLRQWVNMLRKSRS